MSDTKTLDTKKKAVKPAKKTSTTKTAAAKKTTTKTASKKTETVKIVKAAKSVKAIKSNTEFDLSVVIKSSLEDGKAEDLVVIDLKGKTNIADYMIVASGTSSRHVLSLADNLVTKLKKYKIVPRVEGKQQADWVLIDAGNIIVHLFRPEVRQYYNLEKMWSFATDIRNESLVG
ncbi:MAG: ribosome silencing factor [Alphaproteobacteria bacterium]